MDELPTVRWERTLVIEAGVANEDGKTHFEHLRFTREEDGALAMRMPNRPETYYLPPRAIEAIYDLHQEVPR